MILYLQSLNTLGFGMSKWTFKATEIANMYLGHPVYAAAQVCMFVHKS